jgi:hypothetical protein
MASFGACPAAPAACGPASSIPPHPPKAVIHAARGTSPSSRCPRTLEAHCPAGAGETLRC